MFVHFVQCEGSVMLERKESIGEESVEIMEIVEEHFPYMLISMIIVMTQEFTD